MWEFCRDDNWDDLDPIQKAISKLVNEEGDTLLTFSIKQNNGRVFLRLVEKRVALLETVDGDFPIHLAARRGLRAFVQTLLIHNPAGAGNRYKQTPLHLASQGGHKEVIADLLKHDPRIMAYKDDSFNLPPVGLALMNGDLLCLDLFLQHAQMDWSVKFAGVGNLLHAAILYEKNRVLARLLTLYYPQVVPQLDECNDKEQTPLMLAAFQGNLEGMQLLLDRGASIDKVNGQGDTALHWAKKQKKAAELLYAHDATRFANRLGEIPEPFEGVEHQKRPRVLGFQDCPHNGLPYAEALEALESSGKLKGIKFLAGTSVGSVVAALAALNCPSRQIMEILKTIRISEKLTFKASVRPPSAWTCIKTTIFVIANLPTGIWGFGKQVLLKGVEEGIKFTGLISGEPIRELIEELISKQTGIPFFTFGDLHKAILQGKYNHLYLFSKMYSTNITLVLNSEDPRWMDVVVSDAVTGSLLRPITFQPQRLHIRLPGGQRSPHSEVLDLVDGAQGYTMEYFDRKRFSTPNYTLQDRDDPMHNERALDFTSSVETDQLLERPPQPGQDIPPDDVVILKYSKLPPLPPGIYAFAQCGNIACKDLDQEKWIKITPSGSILDIGQVEADFICPCCKTLLGVIRKIALSNRKCSITYGDKEGQTTDHRSNTLIEWTGNPRYVHLTIN